MANRKFHSAKWTARTDKTWGTVYQLTAGRRVLLELFWIPLLFEGEELDRREGWRVSLETCPGAAPDLNVWLPKYVKGMQIALAKRKAVQLFWHACARRLEACHLAQMMVLDLFKDSNA